MSILKDFKKGTRVYFTGYCPDLPSYNIVKSYMKKGQVNIVEEIIEKGGSGVITIVLKEYPGIEFPCSMFRQVNKNMLLHLKNLHRDRCKGLYFRGHYTEYFDGQKVERKEGVRFLKRMSCEGCDYCGFMLDDIAEGFLNGDCNHVILPNNIEHGALYSVAVTDESRDWETGQIDEWTTEFYKVNEDLCIEENFKKLKRRLTWTEMDRKIEDEKINKKIK